MTLDDQLAAARRELALRQRVYPGWVRGNRMSKEKADHEIAAMAAIVETLTTVSILHADGLAWIMDGKGNAPTSTT